MSILNIGHCSLDTGRIVGTVTTATGLQATGQVVPGTDLVEVRLDLTGWEAEDWPNHCRAIEEQGFPVILTPRMAAEGGKWVAAETKRASIYRTALQTASAVDVELRSALAPEICAMAAQNGKAVILSFHDFEKTPSFEALSATIQQMHSLGDVVAKAACMVNDEADLDTLERVLSQTWHMPVCLIGMGPLGARTRLEFPRCGSCLTYGFLDATSAPGQYSCRELVERLKGQGV